MTRRDKDRRSTTQTWCWETANATVTFAFPAQQRQFLQERPDEALKSQIVRGCRQEYDNAPRARLMCARRERPNYRSRKEGDEIPPPHGHIRISDASL